MDSSVVASIPFHARLIQTTYAQSLPTPMHCTLLPCHTRYALPRTLLQALLHSVQVLWAPHHVHTL